MSSSVDLATELETKVRHVRTASGVRRYNLPIGSPITGHPSGRSSGRDSAPALFPHPLSESMTEADDERFQRLQHDEGSRKRRKDGITRANYAEEMWVKFGEGEDWNPSYDPNGATRAYSLRQTMHSYDLDPNEYGDGTFASAIANGEWTKYAPARQIRGAAWAMLGYDVDNEDSNNSLVDPHINRDYDDRSGHGSDIAEENADYQAVALLRGIRDANYQDQPLYRGVRHPEFMRFIENLRQGDVFDLPLASFTDDRRAANKFGQDITFKITGRWRGVQGNTWPAMDEDGEYDWSQEDDLGEYIAGGRFRIVRITNTAAGATVTIEQVMVFDIDKGGIAVKALQDAGYLNAGGRVLPFDSMFTGTIPGPKKKVSSSKELAEELETKLRHVRTPSGVRRFDKPIGSIITAHDYIAHPRERAARQERSKRRGPKGHLLDDGGPKVLGSAPTKGSSSGLVASLAHTVASTNGGVTINVDGGMPDRGIAYAPAKETERIIDAKNFSEDDVAKYMDDHADLLAVPGNHLGIWQGGDGKYYLDVSRVAEPNKRAISDAQKAQQLAVYDIGSGKEVNIGTIDKGGKYHAIAEAGRGYPDKWEDGKGSVLGTEGTTDRARNTRRKPTKGEAYDKLKKAADAADVRASIEDIYTQGSIDANTAAAEAHRKAAKAAEAAGLIDEQRRHEKLAKERETVAEHDRAVMAMGSGKAPAAKFVPPRPIDGNYSREYTIDGVRKKYGDFTEKDYNTYVVMREAAMRNDREYLAQYGRVMHLYVRAASEYGGLTSSWPDAPAGSNRSSLKDRIEKMRSDMSGIEALVQSDYDDGFTTRAPYKGDDFFPGMPVRPTNPVLKSLTAKEINHIIVTEKSTTPDSMAIREVAIDALMRKAASGDPDAMRLSPSYGWKLAKEDSARKVPDHGNTAATRKMFRKEADKRRPGTLIDAVGEYRVGKTDVNLKPGDRVHRGSNGRVYGDFEDRPYIVSHEDGSYDMIPNVRNAPVVHFAEDSATADVFNRMRASDQDYGWTSAGDTMFTADVPPEPKMSNTLIKVPDSVKKSVKAAQKMNGTFDDWNYDADGAFNAEMMLDKILKRAESYQEMADTMKERLAKATEPDVDASAETIAFYNRQIEAGEIPAKLLNRVADGLDDLLNTKFNDFTPEEFDKERRRLIPDSAIKAAGLTQDEFTRENLTRLVPDFDLDHNGRAIPNDLYIERMQKLHDLGQTMMADIDNHLATNKDYQEKLLLYPEMNRVITNINMIELPNNSDKLDRNNSDTKAALALYDRAYGVYVSHASSEELARFDIKAPEDIKYYDDFYRSLSNLSSAKRSIFFKVSNNGAARIRKETIRDYLSQIRPMGVRPDAKTAVNPQFEDRIQSIRNPRDSDYVPVSKDPIPDADAVYDAAMAQAFELYPTAWLNVFQKGRYHRAWVASRAHQISPTRPGDAEFNGTDVGRLIALGAATREDVGAFKNSRDLAAVHELGHAMETGIPGITALEWSLLYKRAKTRSGDWEHMKRFPYNKSEFGFPDEFSSPYAGRNYTTMATDGVNSYSEERANTNNWELFTTGLEDLWSPATGDQRNYAKDPEVTNFMIAALAVLHDVPEEKEWVVTSTTKKTTTAAKTTKKTTTTRKRA